MSCTFCKVCPLFGEAKEGKAKQKNYDLDFSVVVPTAV